MTMDTKRINELIDKYADGTASPAEEQEINDWYRETAYQDAEFPDNEDETYHSILAYLNKATKSKSYFGGFKKWVLAASVTIFLTSGVTIYILNYYQGTSDKLAKNLISPGKNRAVLTLADGKKIYLNDAANGNLATQGNIQVTKTKNGQLVYTVRTSTSSAFKDNPRGSIEYNTIETPAGGQYQIILPDQSKVWLNAMSSLKFPITFDNQNERRVELKGEGYFDVVHNDKVPFKVVTGGLLTEDIGTIFNIKAYTDDRTIKMTLIKGAASVTDGKTKSFLKPGEQASYHGNIDVSEVNVDDVIAWKNGYFQFDDDKLEEVMKTISRWYAVTYVFKDESLKQETFGAVTNRFSDINDLLKLMENSGSAHFEVDGRTIFISKKAN